MISLLDTFGRHVTSMLYKRYYGEIEITLSQESIFKDSRFSAI